MTHHLSRIQRRQLALIEKLCRIGGPVSLDALRVNGGERTLRTLAERGFVQITIDVTDAGRAILKET